MSIGSGGVSSQRFKVLGKTPSEFNIRKVLSEHNISPIDLEDVKEYSCGFCHPYTGSPIDGALDTNYEEGFVFGVREDKKAVPTTTLRMRIKEAVDSMKGGDHNKKISKKIRDSIRDQIKLELLTRAVPSSRIIEVIWDQDAGEIYILNSAASTANTVKMLMFNAFGLTLAPLNPGTICFDFEQGDTLKVLEMVPINFMQ